MPELPEVEVVRAGLEPAVTGATVTEVTVLDERSLRRHPGPAEDFIERLTGATLLAPARRGKYMWIPLRFDEFSRTPGTPPSTSSGNGNDRPPLPSQPPLPELVEGAPGQAVVVHLGMSGQVLLREPSVEDRLTRI